MRNDSYRKIVDKENKRWAFNKLYPLKLTEYEKIVFLDFLLGCYVG